MEDRLLKFAQVVNSGSFSKAAEALHVSQPALSVAVAQLETQLGAPLLVRTTRPLQVTPAGRQAYEAAREIMSVGDDLRRGLSELGRSRQSLVVGMTDSMAQILLQNDAGLRAFEDLAQLSLVVHNSRFLYQGVACNELDAAFAVDTTDLLVSGLESEPVGNEALVLVCHNLLAPMVQRDLQRGRLRNFISYDRMSVTSQLVAHSLAASALHVSAGFYSTSPEVIMRLVLLRQGPAVLPLTQVQPLVQTGQLAMLTLAGNTVPFRCERPIALITRRRRRSVSAVRYLSTQLSAQLAELQ